MIDIINLKTKIGTLSVHIILINEKMLGFQLYHEVTLHCIGYEVGIQLLSS